MKHRKLKNKDTSTMWATQRAIAVRPQAGRANNVVLVVLIAAIVTGVFVWDLLSR